MGQDKELSWVTSDHSFWLVDQTNKWSTTTVVPKVVFTNSCGMLNMTERVENGSEFPLKMLSYLLDSLQRFRIHHKFMCQKRRWQSVAPQSNISVSVFAPPQSVLHQTTNTITHWWTCTVCPELMPIIGIFNGNALHHNPWPDSIQRVV